MSSGGNGMWRKKATREVTPRARELGRDAHEVVVVDPHEVVRPGRAGDALRELAVDRLVGRPVRRIEVAHREEVVEERPDDLVREAGVEAVPLLRRERDRDQVVAEPPARVREERRRVGQLLLRGPGPADPAAAAVPEDRPQRRDEAAAAGLDLPLPRSVARDGEGKAVRDDDEVHAARPSLAALQAARNSKSSSGGRIHACARVGWGVARTSTDSPRSPSAAKASSSVRSSPR